MIKDCVIKMWEAQGPPTRDPRGLVEQPGQEVPFRLSEQEAHQEPEQEPGLPCVFAPQHGGAPKANARPVIAPSRAQTPGVGAETHPRLADADIPRRGRVVLREKAVARPWVEVKL